jgi:hypothetical protein
MFTVYHAYSEDITAEIGQPDLPNPIPQFIYNQQHSDYTSDTSSADLPTFYGKVTVAHVHLFFRSLMRVSNTPVPLYIGSRMWVIDGTILAYG